MIEIVHDHGRFTYVLPWWGTVLSVVSLLRAIMKVQCMFSRLSLTVALLGALGGGGGGCAEPTPITGGPTGELSSLTIEPSNAGQLTPPFESTTMSYAMSVANDLPSVTVTANTEDTDSTIAINGLTVPPGARQSVSLGAPGVPTPIEVVVTTVKGDTNMYVVTVTRLAQCVPSTGEDCCPGDYEERDCGNGSCGKQARTCGATGKWDEWGGCGVNSARTGQVCRAKANVCDPAEVCGGAAIDCPADYIEYPRADRAGCWQNLTATFNPGKCNADGCYPNHAPTAQRRCEEEGFKVFTSQSSPKVAGNIVFVGYWVDGGPCNSQYGKVGGYCRVQIGGGQMMNSVSCLK